MSDTLSENYSKLNKRYQEIKNQLADLEAKLAESENQCRECKHLNKKIELNIKNKLMAENCELQKQLAEKDKEIEYQESMKILAVENQNKKAIEQLEKVKETAECVLDNALKNSSLNESYYDRLLDEIDNQIKQLNERK